MSRAGRIQGTLPPGHREPSRPLQKRSSSLGADRPSQSAAVVVLPGREAELPRLALSVSEACQVLGVGWDHWREHIEPDVRVVRSGRRKLVAVAELVRWLDAHGQRAPGIADPGLAGTPAATRDRRGARQSRASAGRRAA